MPCVFFCIFGGCRGGGGGGGGRGVLLGREWRGGRGLLAVTFACERDAESGVGERRRALEGVGGGGLGGGGGGRLGWDGWGGVGG